MRVDGGISLYAMGIYIYILKMHLHYIKRELLNNLKKETFMEVKVGNSLAAGSVK